MSTGQGGTSGDKPGRRPSAATLERLGYQHSPSVRERQAAAVQLARRRMSEQDGASRSGVAVALVEEQARERPRTVEEAEEMRRAAKRERRRLRREQREAEARAEAARQLELTAQRLYFWGFFLLPILWLLYLFYFYKEHKTEDANANIKKMYKRIIVLFPFYTAVFVAWVVAYQLTYLKLPFLDIIEFKGSSPGNW